MYRIVAIASLCYSLSGCSALGDVAVVDTAPQQCRLLEELSFHRACDHEGRIVPDDVKEFQRLARNLGADTIQCCRVAENEEVLLLTNPKTGQLCTEARERFASAYICSKVDK
jgi:hypothetical protein